MPDQFCYNPWSITREQKDAGQTILNHTIDKANRFQKSHGPAGFIYAVIKKYSDDNGGYQAALLTYYGFLSIFPLLIVVVSVLEILLRSRPDIQDDLVNHAIQYFPILGDELQSNIHAPHWSGIGLVIGVLFTLWGAKGVADVFRYSLNHIWHVPRVKRPGFPAGALKSFLVILFIAGGFVGAAFLSGFAASLDKTTLFRIVASLVSITVLFAVFWVVFRIGLADYAKAGNAALFLSAISAAIGIQILQIIGGYLITHELNQLTHLYGAFAATLGLFFWIYLQARVIMYAIEIGVVYERKLWPRSLTNQHLTAADKEIYGQHAKHEPYALPEKE
ncbi:YihY/virulence factor BrkB family protein [Candidatus Saccharibacteria bacterium]|nr:YihY/virulence factor BrkB family protein [Candidatus Saccharibacteria bacterium]